MENLANTVALRESAGKVRAYVLDLFETNVGSLLRRHNNKSVPVSPCWQELGTEMNGNDEGFR